MLAQRGRRSEQHAVEERALVPDVDVAIPGEADAAVNLDRVPRRFEIAIGEVRLREGGEARGFLQGHVPGMSGVPEQATRRLGAHGHVGELVLHRLELRDRLAELLARARVRDGHLDETLRAAESIRRQEHACGVAHALRDAFAARERLGRDVVEAEARERTRAVRSLEGDTHRVLGRDERELAGSTRNHDHVGELGRRDTQLLAAHAPAANLRPAAGGCDQATDLLEGDGSDRVACSQRPEPTCALGVAAA